MLREEFINAKRIVIKLGTNVLRNSEGEVAISRIYSFIEDMAKLVKQGKEVILVTSGAVGLGKKKLNLESTAEDGVKQGDRAGDGVQHVGNNAHDHAGDAAAKSTHHNGTDGIQVQGQTKQDGDLAADKVHRNADGDKEQGKFIHSFAVHDSLFNLRTVQISLKKCVK